MKTIIITMILACSTGIFAAEALSPAAVISQAGEDEWRVVEPENILKLTLTAGPVYLEVNPQLAPKHSAHFVSLAKQGYYQSQSMYRVIEGFVAQGGQGEKSSENAAIKNEFSYASEQAMPLDAVLNHNDGYSAYSGFLNGFAVGQNEAQTHTWGLHCYGALGMARGNGVDSATGEFYVVLGPHKRYLDQNITVFGRVLKGMEHVQSLTRDPQANDKQNLIINLQPMSEVAASEQVSFKVMRTDSKSFAKLVEAHKNRPEAWFVHQPDHIDTCSMQVPTKVFTTDD